MERLNSNSLVGGTYYISTVELTYDNDDFSIFQYAEVRYYRTFNTISVTDSGGVVSSSYDFEEIDDPLPISNNQSLTVIWSRSNYDLEFVGIKSRINGRDAIQVLHSRCCASRSIAAVNLDKCRDENPRFDIVEDFYNNAVAAGVTKNHWVIINATELLAIDSTTHSIITVPHELVDNEEL